MNYQKIFPENKKNQIGSLIYLINNFKEVNILRKIIQVILHKRFLLKQ